jgi:hypothetical protein
MSGDNFIGPDIPSWRSVRIRSCCPTAHRHSNPHPARSDPWSGLYASIKATIQAYAEGKISPAEMPMDPKTRDNYICNAPSFVKGICGARSTHPFTEDSLAKFLGMTDGSGRPQEKFNAAFGALELIEQGYLKENQLDDERMGIRSSGDGRESATGGRRRWGPRLGDGRADADLATRGFLRRRRARRGGCAHKFDLGSGCSNFGPVGGRARK